MRAPLFQRNVALIEVAGNAEAALRREPIIQLQIELTTGWNVRLWDHGDSQTDRMALKLERQAPEGNSAPLFNTERITYHDDKTTAFSVVKVISSETRSILL
jgi:hypothetical protein